MSMYYEEVKKCPFCDGYSKLEPKSKTIIKGETRYVTYCRCVECDARGPRILIGNTPCISRNIAIKRWNRRAYED